MQVKGGENLKRLWPFAWILLTILHTYNIFIFQKMLRLEKRYGAKISLSTILAN